jgi:amino acid transporter
MNFKHPHKSYSRMLEFKTLIITANISSILAFLSLFVLRRNIYFRRPETGAMRDIFLAPFSPRLLASVVATGVVIATAMVLVNASIAKRNRKKESDRNNKNSKTKWSLGEAMVWSVSVLCMQGNGNNFIL